MAQERHELQEIGDDLDMKISKAENEIPAMENTLRVISAGNECYKKNLDSIDNNSKFLIILGSLKLYDSSFQCGFFIIQWALAVLLVGLSKSKFFGFIIPRCPEPT